MTLRAAVIDRRGKVGEDVELDGSTCSCCRTDSARIGVRTLVAYRDRTADEIRDIAVVGRGSDGRWSSPRVVNADGWRIAGCPVNGPALATNAGRVLAAWPTLAGESFEVRYTVRGNDDGAPAHPLAGGPGTLGRVDAAAAPGGFLVTWVTARGPDAGVQLARIDRDGSIAEKRTLARLEKPRAAGHPRIASDGDRALVAWTAPAAAGPGTRLQLALLPLARSH
jgi:hypothetical protein